MIIIELENFVGRSDYVFFIFWVSMSSRIYKNQGIERNKNYEEVVLFVPSDFENMS